MAAAVARSSNPLEVPVGRTAGAADFSMQDLQHLLIAEFGTAAAKRLQWAMTPLEYLVRRASRQHLVVNRVSIPALLEHVPSVLESCMQLVSTGTAAQAQAASRKTIQFIVHLLVVLKARGVQNRLGGSHVLQPFITQLEGALQQFRRYAVQQQPLPVASTYAHVAVQVMKQRII